MIKSLILKNFKSHSNSKIEFNPGINIFLGEVGAGKTSILEAISFALFGRYASRVSQSSLIRRGSEKAVVSLVFSTNSARYKIDRTAYSKKTQRAKLWIYNKNKWELAVEGSTAVSGSVEDLLDVDSATFLAAIYASQGEIKEMLETQPGKRRERLDKLLGIDVYENIWDTLGEARSIVLTELTQAQEKASGVDVLEKHLKSLETRMEAGKEELETLKASLKEIDTILQPAEQKIEFFEDLKQKLTPLETRIEGKINEINNSSVTLESLNKMVEKTSESEKVFAENKEFIQLESDLGTKKRWIEAALQQKKSLETLLQRDTTDLQEAEKRQKRLEDWITRLTVLEDNLLVLEKERETLPELRKELLESEKKLDEANANSVRALNQIENQNRKIERVAELGECPTCLQVVPQEHKEKIERETSEAISELRASYTLLEESRRQVQAQIEELREKTELAHEADRKYAEAYAQVRMLKGYKDEIEEAKARINRLEYGIGENKEKIAEIKETPEILAGVNAELQDAVLKADLARKAEKQMAAKEDLQETLLQEKVNLEKMKTQLEDLRLSKKELAEKYDPREHSDMEKTARHLREDRAKTIEAMERLSKSIEDDAYQIKQAESQLKTKIKSRKQVENRKMENRILETLRISLRNVIQPVMRKNNVLKVSGVFQSFYQDLSSDNIDHAALDEEGNINVIRNGEPSPISSLSGGETTCAALALRLAICSSLTKNQLLLLDEPTIHLDELYRANLKGFLSNHSFEQLIVVTHDNTFDSLPAQIFRVEKRRGESTVSPVTQGGA